MFIRGCHGSVMVILACAAPLLGGEGKQVTLQDVIKSWQARAARTRSARFAWSELVTRSKGSMGRPRPPQGGEAASSVIPPKDMTQAFRRTLTFDGENIAYKIDGDFWAHEENTFRPQRYVSASNGKKSKVYWPADIRYPRGFIDSAPKNVDLTSYHIKPLLLVYRILDPKMKGLDPKTLTLSPMSGEVRGQACRCVSWKLSLRPGHSMVESFWVDPKRDFSVLRYTQSGNEKLLLQIDLTYKQHENDGWVPSDWRISVHKPDGALSTSVAAKVTSFSINPVIDPKEFEVDFPEGAMVYDKEKKEEFIVRPDDERRQITPDDRGATYAQLLNSQSGMALSGEGEQHGFWLRAILLIALTIVSLLFVLRFLRRRRNA